jgi:pantetheine-phosphate adenylyltransferase
MSSQESVALFPASFDPVTHGHLDVAHRALRIFGRLVMSVAVNVAKQGVFTVEERLAMLEEQFVDNPRVSVTSFDTLSVDFAREVGANVIIRGVRAMSDFEYEFEMALMNKHLNPEIETVFMMPSQEYLYVSSSRLKELVRFGRDVEEFLPPNVAKQLRERLSRI